MNKVALVISFDEPEDDLLGSVGVMLDSLRENLHVQSNVNVWIGIRQSAEEVLNVIGLSNERSKDREK